MTPNSTWRVGVIHFQLVEMRAFGWIWKVDLNLKKIENKINPLTTHQWVVGPCFPLSLPLGDFPRTIPLGVPPTLAWIAVPSILFYKLSLPHPTAISCLFLLSKLSRQETNEAQISHSFLMKIEQQSKGISQSSYTSPWHAKGTGTCKWHTMAYTDKAFFSLCNGKSRGKHLLGFMQWLDMPGLGVSVIFWVFPSWLSCILKWLPRI